MENILSDAETVKFEEMMMFELELSNVEDPAKLSAVQRICHVFPAHAQVSGNVGPIRDPLNFY